jgi:hypothetical protein
MLERTIREQRRLPLVFAAPCVIIGERAAEMIRRTHGL